MSPVRLDTGRPHDSDDGVAGYRLPARVFFWRHLEHAADLADVAELAARRYPDPIQILRLDEPAVEPLEPVLDDLAALTAEPPEAAEFFRLRSLVDELLAGRVARSAARWCDARWRSLRGVAAIWT